jgi:hypothetical protein
MSVALKDKKLDLTEDERAALRELAKTRIVRWWKNYPFVIAILGFLIAVFSFLLSLGTSMYAIHTNRQKDIHDQLSELAAAIRTIQELNLKQVEIREKYKGTRDELQAGRLISNQINTTVLLASDIAFRLGTHATTSALIPLSEGLYNYGDYSKAQDLAQLALNSARGAEDEASALRVLGYMKIRSGSKNSLDEGNELYRRAVTIERKYDVSRFSPDKVYWLKAYGYQRWAYALAAVDCDEARKQFVEFVTILNASSVRNQIFDRMRGDAQRAMTGGIGAVRACMPAPETPPIQQPQQPSLTSDHAPSDSSR